MQRDRGPDRLDIAFVDAMAPQEVAGEVGPVHLKPLMSARTHCWWMTRLTHNLLLQNLLCFQQLRVDRQRPDALAGRGVDRIADRRRGWRHTGLADAARG
jgi:hypothetical protein